MSNILSYYYMTFQCLLLVQGNLYIFAYNPVKMIWLNCKQLIKEKLTIVVPTKNIAYILKYTVCSSNLKCSVNHSTNGLLYYMANQHSLYISRSEWHIQWSYLTNYFTYCQFISLIQFDNINIIDSWTDMICTQWQFFFQFFWFAQRRFLVGTFLTTAHSWNLHFTIPLGCSAKDLK